MIATQAKKALRSTVHVGAVAIGVAALQVVWQFGVAQAARVRAPGAAAPTVFYACFVPSSGTVYLIKEPGLRDDCASPSHLMFSWTDGAGAIKSGDAASGDLSGTYPGPTVAKLQGKAVDGTTPTTGQVLKYNGTAWAPGKGGVSGYTTAFAIVTTPIPNGNTFHVAAACPAGKVVTGGGYSLDALIDGLSVFFSAPELTGSNIWKWHVAGWNRTGSEIDRGIEVTAICVDAS